MTRVKPIVGAMCALLFMAAQEQPTPARYVSGELPAIPVQTVGAGQVFVELAVTASGTVSTATILRATPPFTDAVVSAVQSWRFDPARDSDDPKEPLRDTPSTVLVAAIFRPPTMLNGPVAGTPPKDVGGAVGDHTAARISRCSGIPAEGALERDGARRSRRQRGRRRDRRAPDRVSARIRRAGGECGASVDVPPRAAARPRRAVGRVSHLQLPPASLHEHAIQPVFMVPGAGIEPARSLRIPGF